MVNIPVIDFSGYRSAGSVSERRKTADTIVNAFKDSGFVYLKGHGIPDTTVKNVFERVRFLLAVYRCLQGLMYSTQSAQFFDLPHATKVRNALPCIFRRVLMMRRPSWHGRTRVRTAATCRSDVSA